MTALAVAQFILDHLDIIQDIASAIEGGVTKDTIRKAVRDAMVAASDAEMERELG